MRYPLADNILTSDNKNYLVVATTRPSMLGSATVAINKNDPHLSKTTLDVLLTYHLQTENTNRCYTFCMEKETLKFISKDFLPMICGYQQVNAINTDDIS